MAAAREGRLYVDETRKTVSKEDVRTAVRAHVARIRVLATPRFRESVDELWEQILADDEFVEFLTPGSKARKSRTFDKYNTARIIGILREKGVYQQYSDRRFDTLLEPEQKDSPYRRYLSAGIEKSSRQLLLKIRGIVAL